MEDQKKTIALHLLAEVPWQKAKELIGDTLVYTDESVVQLMERIRKREKTMTAEELGQELFEMHTHAELCHESDIVCREEDLIGMLVRSGMPTPVFNATGYTESIFEKKETILEEAQRLIYGNRQADYGTVRENFGLIADLWSPILGVKITPEQAILCMIQVKVARYMHKPKRDSVVDIAGYAGCLEKLENDV